MAPLGAALTAALFLAAPTDGVKPQPRLRGGEIETVAMHLYRGDCGKPAGFSLAARVPGAGMDPAAIKPFTTVLKDGFFLVDCVKDYLFEHGDKFGDNKASYELGHVTNVSIVHYAAHVPKEDREAMTHEVCFRFCRTVPDMAFFGLTNGRECYCAPYYKAEAGDSSDCDAVCDGDQTTMCGGRTKSSVFAMHACAGTASALNQAKGGLSEALDAVRDEVKAIGTTPDTMMTLANAYQDQFGRAGDPQAADLMQKAKVFVGEIKEHLDDASELQDKTGAKLLESAGTLASGDMKAPATVTKAEELIKSMERCTTDAEVVAEQLQSIMAPATEAQARPGGALAQYYPAMHFVDTEFEKAASTCSGALVQTPLFLKKDECARACDSDVEMCTAFGFYADPAAADGAGLCFLFSRLEALRYYTGCAGETGVQCFLKFSKYEGTSIKPDGSGKCEGCLKAAERADRCFK